MTNKSKPKNQAIANEQAFEKDSEIKSHELSISAIILSILLVVLFSFNYISSDTSKKESTPNITTENSKLFTKREQKDFNDLTVFYNEMRDNTLIAIQALSKKINEEQQKNNLNFEELDKLQKKLQENQLDFSYLELSYKNARTLEQFKNFFINIKNKKHDEYQNDLNKKEKAETEKEEAKIIENIENNTSKEILFLKEKLNQLEKQNQKIIKQNEALIMEKENNKSSSYSEKNEDKEDKKPFKEAPQIEYEPWIGIK